jgi:hypothetical protein
VVNGFKDWYDKHKMDILKLQKKKKDTKLKGIRSHKSKKDMLNAMAKRERIKDKHWSTKLYTEN